MTLERMVLALGFILMCIGCTESSDEATHSEVGRYAIVLRPLGENITHNTATEGVYDLRTRQRRAELLKHTTYLVDTSEGRTWYYDYSLQAWVPVDRHETREKRIELDNKMSAVEAAFMEVKMKQFAKEKMKTAISGGYGRE
ncbi:MAG: hypothetical protein O7H41_03410 [Planctomycetota bacterium]|nr:hypothetical protein [Planctomycetota bacterium]